MQFFAKFQKCQTQTRNSDLDSATNSPVPARRSATNSPPPTTNSPLPTRREFGQGIRNSDSVDEGDDFEVAQIVRVLQLENKTLRLALAQSATNAARWENEMKALEEQNQRLLRALTNRQRSSTASDNDHQVTNIIKKNQVTNITK